ncbi:hypothetical protein AMATHDRAFT_1307 [Amanita thiersii Skay4041]|uniref:Major facilitator superfamily (MFS) profile domain-containing protein n=1 Tax=Amanita thiersii Skay4041 TaxID=703135 RepID=A0A2A9NZ00_9AGAR|nr:hypothetical protein AMATHDRAFT_1307 [Amanita thiersii Skay4041]
MNELQKSSELLPPVLPGSTAEGVMGREKINPRIRLSSIPDATELDAVSVPRLNNPIQSQPASNDTTFVASDDDQEEKLKTSQTIGSDDPIYIDWEEGDRRNPANFPRKTKWMITAIACYATLLSASVAGTYNMGLPSMIRDLNCTRLQALTGLSVYALGFGLIPLVSASFSEEFGRKPLYITSALIFLLMYMMVALAKNVQTVIVARFIQGASGSTGATMVGGTIADIWGPRERGLPMSIFAVAAVGGTGLGPVMAGWIEMNSRLEWRWIQWIQMILYLLLTLVMKETRSAVLLTRHAKRIRKETGDKRYRARVEDELAKNIGFSALPNNVCILDLMFTEPIVGSFSLWVGFAWGVCYSLIASIPLVVQTVYGFSIGDVGTTFVSMVIGSFFGFFMNLKQEALYRNNYSKRGPEARLYGACVAAIMLPVGMFIYAWTSIPSAHWIGLNVGIVLFMWAMYTIYVAVFSYLSDCYGTYASSANAGQSLARNMAATAFPLFTTQMFQRLTYPWASTLFACIATVMIPIPYVSHSRIALPSE